MVLVDPPRRRRRRRRTREHHRLATGLLQRSAPCLRAGVGRSSTGSGPPVRPVRLRQLAATVPGGGPGQRRHGTHGSTIDEYVQATASTEQAAALGDFADKPLIVLTAGSGHDAAQSAAQTLHGRVVNQQRASHHRRRHPRGLDHRPRRRRRHHPSNPRRRLSGPQQRRPDQVIPSLSRAPGYATAPTWGGDSGGRRPGAAALRATPHFLLRAGITGFCDSRARDAYALVLPAVVGPSSRP